MKSVDEYYLVKYVDINDMDFKTFYFATYIHKDMIDSYLKILKTKDIDISNKKRDLFGSCTFKELVGIYFSPATNEYEYNTIIVLVEDDDWGDDWEGEKDD